MATITTDLTRFTSAGVESADRFAKISMDSAERAIALQLGFARQALEQATVDVRAIANAKDVKDLVELRAKLAGHAFESWIGYSQSLMEVASQARAEYAKLAEERLGTMREALAESVEYASRTAPAGSEAAVAALKSSIAAGNAAFDTFSSAAREAAALADAGVKRGTTKRRTKK
jgi:phasin family protein